MLVTTLASSTFWTIDAPAMLAGTLAAFSCALLGNFLVLRRLSLMGDAIAHAVLPGLVLGFLLSGTASAWALFLGALLSGVATVVLVEIIRSFGRVESSAAMGVVFSVLFALGVLLLEQANARGVHLDAECMLYGQPENIFIPLKSTDAFFSIGTLSLIPHQVTSLVMVCFLVVAFVVLFFKELRISAFDPGLATTVGVPAQWMHYALMTLVAVAAVASFEAVGSILVVAMLICPAATARLLTDRLGTQIVLSGLIAIATGVCGYLAGAFGPGLLGFDHSVSAAGSMTLVAGALLFLAIFLAPEYGIIASRLRRLRVALQVMVEDVLGVLYRLEELIEGMTAEEIESAGIARTLTRPALLAAVGDGYLARWAVRRGQRSAYLKLGDNGDVQLTPEGRWQARSIVRSHRLWETYLNRVLGLPADHVHATAERLEHLRTTKQERLEPELEEAIDPHGKRIPE